MRLYSEPLQFHSKQYLDPLKSRQLGRICWIVLFKRHFWWSLIGVIFLNQGGSFYFYEWIRQRSLRSHLQKMTFMSTTQLKTQWNWLFKTWHLSELRRFWSVSEFKISLYDRYVVQLWCSNLPYINYYINFFVWLICLKTWFLTTQ